MAASCPAYPGTAATRRSRGRSRARTADLRRCDLHQPHRPQSLATPDGFHRPNSKRCKPLRSTDRRPGEPRPWSPPLLWRPTAHPGAVPSKSVARLEAGARLCGRPHAYLPPQGCFSSPLETGRRNSSTATDHCPSRSLSAPQTGAAELSKTRLSDLYRPHTVTTTDPSGLSVALGDPSQFPRPEDFARSRSAAGPDRTRCPHYRQLRRVYLRSAAACTPPLPPGTQPAAASSMAATQSQTPHHQDHHSTGHCLVPRRTLGLRTRTPE
jgi:hypothetical protein